MPTAEMQLAGAELASQLDPFELLLRNAPSDLVLLYGSKINAELALSVVLARRSIDRANPDFIRFLQAIVLAPRPQHRGHSAAGPRSNP